MRATVSRRVAREAFISTRTHLAGAVGFVLVSFSLNSIVTRYLVARGLLDPGLVTAVRFLAGALALLVLLAARRELALARPTRRNLVPAFWLASYAILISYGYAFIGAAAGTFVFYASVLATMTGAAIVLERRRPAPRVAIGGVLALAGLGILAYGRAEGTLLGVLLLTGTGVAWGAYSHMGRSERDAVAFTSGNFMVFAVALIVPTALLFARVPFTPVITSGGIALAAGMGALTTALSYAVWYWVIPQLAPGQAGTYQLAIPVLTGFMAVVLLGETLTIRLLIAGAVVVAGMALAASPHPTATASDQSEANAP